MKLKNSRRAGMFDLFLAIILSFILAVCLVVFSFAQNEVEDQYKEDTERRAAIEEEKASVILAD